MEAASDGLPDAGEPPLTVEEIAPLLRSEDPDDRADGLSELSVLVDAAYDEQAIILGQEVRDAGLVPLLGLLAIDEQSAEVQQRALLVLGNLCSDQVDPFSHLTKTELLAQGGNEAMVLALESDDPSTLLYACGCLQNLCHDHEWALALANVDGVQARLEALTVMPGHERLAHYAAGALKNMLTRLQEASGGAALAGLSAEAQAAVEQRGLDAILDAMRQRRAVRLIKRFVQRIPPEKRLERVLSQRFTPAGTSFTKRVSCDPSFVLIP